jgi:4-carboxymuconolactone decarboxylase
LSALLALGADAALDFHFNASLNVSSIEEVRDLIIQTYFISGFAITIANFKVFDTILEARKEIKGKENPAYKDKQASVQEEKWKEGANIGEKLLGKKMWENTIAELKEFDPSVAEYFSRDIFDKFFSFSKVLSTKTQLLCLVAALTVLDNMPQLKVTVLMALRAGCTDQEVKEVIFQMSGYHGWPTAFNAIKAFQEVHSNLVKP